MATEHPIETLKNIKEKDKNVIKTHWNRRLENMFCEEMTGNSSTYTENHDKINWDRPDDLFEETRDKRGRLIITPKKG